MKYKYVFFNMTYGLPWVIDKDEFNYICVNDLRRLSNVQVIDVPFQKCTQLFRMFACVCRSHRLNRIIEMPFKHFFDPLSFTSRFSNESDVCFVFLSMPGDVECMRWLRKKYDKVKFVKIYRDLLRVFSIGNLRFTDDVRNEIFDLQASYDEEEAKKFGWLFFDEYSSKIKVRIEKQKFSDVFFAGKVKNRLSLLLKIYEKFSKSGIKCEYFLVGVPKNQRIILPGVKYADELMSYREMLYRTVNSGCVLEINQEDAVGNTSRFLEAVMYNKKLISNTQCIVNSKFYDRRYIQIFKNVDDIDVGFLKHNQVDYHYNDEFSPIRVLEKIDKKLVEMYGK